jgi:hypothetical protein
MRLARITRFAVAMAALTAAAVAAPATAEASAIHPDGFPFPYQCQDSTSDFRYVPGTTYGSGTADCVGDDTYELVNQSDGNLVIYGSVGQALWSSSTDVGAAAYDVMQSDGNFVVYRQSNGAALWSTDTSGHSGAYLCFQLDGNLVVYAPGGSCSGKALWASGT